MSPEPELVTPEPVVVVSDNTDKESQQSQESKSPKRDIVDDALKLGIASLFGIIAIGLAREILSK